MAEMLLEDLPIAPTLDDLRDAVSMPAITLWQPYACLIEVKAKVWETRSFRCPPRLLGKRVAIHAAVRKPRNSDFDEATYEAISEVFPFCGWMDLLPRGVVVCTARITGCWRTDERLERDHFGDYSPGRFMWRIEDVEPIEPHVPAKGRQQIGWSWTPPSAIHPPTGS